jgi:hypothetical protein
LGVTRVRATPSAKREPDSTRPCHHRHTPLHHDFGPCDRSQHRIHRLRGLFEFDAAIRLDNRHPRALFGGLSAVALTIDRLTLKIDARRRRRGRSTGSGPDSSPESAMCVMLDHLPNKWVRRRTTDSCREGLDRIRFAARTSRQCARRDDRFMQRQVSRNVSTGIHLPVQGAPMKVKTKVKAGKIATNHNVTVR